MTIMMMILMHFLRKVWAAMVVSADNITQYHHTRVGVVKGSRRTTGIPCWGCNPPFSHAVICKGNRWQSLLRAMRSSHATNTTPAADYRTAAH